MKYFETESGILYNENCIDTMSRMKDNYIDLTVTSPPYDNLRNYQGYEFDYKTVIKELYRITKIGGVVVWVVGDATVNGSETGTSFRQALFAMECGFNLYDTMIYAKNNALPLNDRRYEPMFEYMFVFSKGKPNIFNPLKEASIHSDKINTGTYREANGELKHKNGYGKQIKKEKVKKNIWFYNVGKNMSTKDLIAFKHPASFPEKLANDHIISWSNENDLVYDCFSGSGTVWKMAEKLNRKFIGSEISADYCEIAKQRILSLDKYNYVSKLF